MPKTMYGPSPLERLMRRKPTSEERAQAKREAAFRHVCWTIRDAIEALPREPASFTQAPAFFGALADKTPQERYAALRELDDGLGTHWHSLLRSCRNHPVHGPALLDVINGRARS